jgi:hypothetical protein
MARPKNPVPDYQLHKPSGQARVRIDGRDVYLGRYDSPESRREYARIVAELTSSTATQTVAAVVRGATVNEVLAGFWRHAQDHYRRPDGTPTNELKEYRLALRPVATLYGHTPAAEFGPVDDYPGDLFDQDVLGATPDGATESGGGTQCTQSTQSTQVYSGSAPEGEGEFKAAGEPTEVTERTGSTEFHPPGATAEELVAAFLADLRRTDGKYPAWRIPFELARVLRALPVESPVAFEDVVTGFFLALGADEFAGWVSFLACWALVRCPAGQDDWDLAVAAARARPLSIRPDPGPQLRTLASVAAYLNAARPGEPLVFSLPRIERSFGCPRVTASRAVKALVALGVIVCVDPTWSYTEGRARTFRFAGAIHDPAEGSPG